MTFKVLYIFPNVPLDANYSGAASRYLQNFLALKDLGIELHVLRFYTKNHMRKVLDVERSSKTAQIAYNNAASWSELELPIPLPYQHSNSITKLDSFIKDIFRPIETEFPKYGILTQEIRSKQKRIQPNLLWAEHSFAATAVWRARSSLPWVYSHIDTQYLVRSIRNNRPSWYHSLFNLINRSIETRVSRDADFVITGSITEKERLKNIGCRSISVIPMINHNFARLDPNFSLSPDLKIIHLGSLETTANRSGLISYLSLAHQSALERLQAMSVEITLMIIGDATHLKPPLSELLLQPCIVCTGYVANLSTVLRPYDIAIFPYTQDSGYRTKLPLLMGYAQVIVATRAAVAGSLLPGLEQVCVLLDRVEEFPAKIAWLAAHPEERKRLGLAGRAFAERHFSLEAVRPLYSNLMRQIEPIQPPRPRIRA